MMEQNVLNPQMLKKYLLGQLKTEEQLAFVEERLLLDENSFEELQLVKDDLLDQYVNNELIPQERKAFEQKFLTTAERREDLVQARALVRYAKKGLPHTGGAEEKKTFNQADERRPRFAWIRLMPTTNWGVALATLLIVAVGVVTWRSFFYRSDLNQGLLALKTAYRLERPVEARLSGLDYAPLANTRGGQSRVDLTSRQRAEKFLFYAEKDDPGRESYHALGLLYVTEGKFYEAIQQLKKALEINPNDPQLHSDLGAALLEKAKSDQLNGEEGTSVEEFSESLEHLNRALTLNSSLLEALFNRALCRQYLHLYELGAEDWRLYLEKDSQSEWAREARENLKLIESHQPKGAQNNDQVLDKFLVSFRDKDDETAWQLLSGNRDVTRGFLQNALLDRYFAQDANVRPNETEETLPVVIYASELESRRAQDRFLADLVQFYQTLTPSQRNQVAQARQILSEGHKNLNALKPEEALSFYTKAKSVFDQLGDNIESLYVTYPIGHAHLLMHESERSLSIFREVAHSAEAKSYRWLLGQSLSGIASVQTGLDEYSAALDNSFRSLKMSEEIGDIRGQVKAADQLSNIYRRLGDYSKAIEYQERGLQISDKHPGDSAQAWRSHFLMALSLHMLGWDEAAEGFLRDSLNIQGLTPYNVCRSQIALGVIYSSQLNYEEARKSVRLALDLAQSISSKATRIDTTAYSALQLGHLYRQTGEFDRAMASYDEVLKTYEGTDYPAFLYAAHKGKLLSCLARSDCAEADHEISTTLDLFEDYRSRILEETNKFIFFDAEQNVYDAVIQYESEKDRNSGGALNYSERSRARSLLGLTAESIETESHSHHTNKSEFVSSRPLSWIEITQRMPAESQLLEYSVLPEKTLMWVVSSTGMQSFEQQINAEDLRDKVIAYLRFLSNPPLHNEEAVKTASEEFYDLLIKPVKAALDPKKQLCIVPDKTLNYLPFGAFISRVSGKYLMQEHILTRAPSATLFILSSESASIRTRVVNEKLLSVGNPRFDHSAFPGLADLPSAKREAEEIADLYNSTTPLSGENALKSRVMAEMEKAEVIHLALHAVVNEHSPLHSKLLLAKARLLGDGSEDDGTLEMNELATMQLRRARLVVLSACQSGTGRYYGGEGMIGISRPFIAKGVPLVVGSLWAVDSNATAELMISFHKKRAKDKVPTAEALTLAQREMLVHPDERYRHPYYWAPFVLMGGYARF